MQQAGWQQELGRKADCRSAPGKRIAELRQERGMSQNDLAIQLQKCGLDVDKNAIQLLEHGHRYVRDMELFLIAKILKVHMEDLFVGVRIDL